MIIIQSTNYKVILEGYIKTYSSKLGREVTIATNGLKKESYLRYVDEYRLIISECSQENYVKLRNIFKVENLFLIKDTVRSIEDGDLFFDMDNIELSEIENKKDKEFIFSGTLEVRKV